MDNTDLFDFEFTDRSKERCKLINFLRNPEDKVLWVYGKSGTGKSFFVTECLKIIHGYHVIYIENTKNTKDGDCIFALIEEMQKEFNTDFYNFINKHYRVIRAIVTDVGNYKDSLKSNLLRYAFSKNFYYIDKENEYNDFAEILRKYTDAVIKSNKIIFVVDNLNQCDENSFNVLLNFAKCNVGNEQCRFIFISTDSEKGDQPFEKVLIRELPYKHLPICKIPDGTYFINMLPRQFDTANLSEYDIVQIYNFCQGLPEKFQDLLANLDRKAIINYSDTKIEINRDKMINYIVSTSDSSIDFNQYNYTEQSIMLVIVCLAMPVRLDLLKEISIKLYEKLFYMKPTEEIWIKNIEKLHPKPLKLQIEHGQTYLYTDHDLTFNAALLYFSEQNIYQIACAYIYDILKKINQQIINECFDIVDLYEINADLSFNAQYVDWEKINCKCGEYFYNSYNFIRANKYFCRLLNCLEKLDPELILKIGITTYEVGEYNQSNEVLMKIPESKIKNKYAFYIYIGKSYNMLAKGELAIPFFDKAAISAREGTDDRLYAIYMKHLVMLQIPEYKETTKKEYKDLVDKIIVAYKTENFDYLYLRSNARLLKSCYDYYYNNDALQLFEIGEMIAQKCNDKIENAYILHNKGFEYIRQNKEKEALDSFYKSFKILENVKRHEAAYCLNNIAVCKMFKGNYQEAIDHLKMALRYQKSFYLYLTANTMLMQCYRLQNNSQYKILKSSFEEIISERQYRDPAILRKICVNLAICEYSDGMLLTSKKYLDLIIDMVEGTSSEYRVLKLYDVLSEEYTYIDKNYIFKKSEYFNNLDFDPWFITLSHD